MKVNGKIIKLMAKEHSTMFTAISMKANGKEIRPTALENTLIAMELHTKAIGAMICSMDME